MTCYLPGGAWRPEVPAVGTPTQLSSHGSSGRVVVRVRMSGRRMGRSSRQNVVCEAVQRVISTAVVAVVRTALLRVPKSSERVAEVLKGGGGTADEGVAHGRVTAEGMDVSEMVG